MGGEEAYKTKIEELEKALEDQTKTSKTTIKNLKTIGRNFREKCEKATAERDEAKTNVAEAFKLFEDKEKECNEKVEELSKLNETIERLKEDNESNKSRMEENSEKSKKVLSMAKKKIMGLEEIVKNNNDKKTNKKNTKSNFLSEEIFRKF